MILSRVYYSALSIAFPQNNMSFFSNASHFSVHTLTINNVGGNQANSCNDATMHPSISRTDEDEFQVIEQPIRSVPLLTAIAKSISSPSLEVSRQMVLSLLETVARARENKGILLKLTEWTVQVVMSIDDTLRKGNAHLERRHVEALTKSLREVQGCVEEGGQRTWINGSALPRCITSWVSMLEEDLGKILTILNIEKLASLQRLSSMLSSSSLSLVARTIARDDVSLVDEIRRGPDFAVHSVRFDGRFVVLKVFHGSQAGNRLENTLAFSRRFLNPSILNAFATSSSGVPFIVYDESCQVSPEYKIASALMDSLNRGIRLGLTTVGGISAGLDYLFMNNVPPSPLVEEKLEIYITDNDTLKIGFGAINMDVGPAEGNVDDTEDLEDRRWRMFNNLCLKTFKQANCLLYEDENIDENDEPESSFSDITEDSVPSGSTSGPSNSTGSQPRPTGEPFTSVKPRRELVWRVPPERSATVSSVARHYRGYLERARLRNAKYLPLRQLRARIGGQSRVRHRCLGYRKEEITLTASIEESAIVSHATPSLREICLVCNEVVDVGIFECICGLEDDGVSVTVKCSICSTYSHEACVDLQGTHNVFICHLCPRRKSLYPREAGMPKAIRAKSGCYTCKIRRKKCDRWVDEYGRCETCVRLRLQCLGAGDKRSEWLRDNTQELRDKIRNFLVSQGMIRDHSGSGSRALRQDQTLQFSDSQYNVYI